MCDFLTGSLTFTHLYLLTFANRPKHTGSVWVCPNRLLLSIWVHTAARRASARVEEVEFLRQQVPYFSTSTRVWKAALVIVQQCAWLCEPESQQGKHNILKTFPEEERDDVAGDIYSELLSHAAQTQKHTSSCCTAYDSCVVWLRGCIQCLLHCQMMLYYLCSIHYIPWISALIVRLPFLCYFTVRKVNKFFL